MGYMLSVEPGLTIGGISRWCERIVDGIFREPVNALSNLGFMLSGLIMFKVLSDEKPRDDQRFYGVNKTSGMFAAAVIYLGPGSMLMHGTHTDWGQWADNLSMVMFIVFLGSTTSSAWAVGARKNLLPYMFQWLFLMQ